MGSFYQKPVEKERGKMHSDAIAALAQRLPDWYRQAGRDLPWRKTGDPYAIWVSEIMLQQTRVEAVRGYYHRFLEALPTVQALAEAPDDRLRKLWEGLGYYTRVMNMKKAANVMVTRYGGRFPQTYPEVLALPGVGEYTAGAVCSIAFGLPTPAVDGNVLRVLSRLLADPRPVDLPQVKAEARQALAAVYPAGQCAVFTQALMELGATVCLPRGAPKCSQCPMADLCQAREAEQWRSLPARLPKRPRRQAEITVFLLCCQGKIALERRPQRGLLAGLWQFPNVPGWLTEQAALAQAAAWQAGPVELTRRADRVHVFTHVQWQMRCYRIRCQAMPPGFTWLTPAQVEAEAALPTAFRQFWDLIDNFQDL